MSNKIDVEYVNCEDYRLYNLAIERLTKVIRELGYAISNCKDLEDNGFEMDSFKLQDAIVEIATFFAEVVDGLKYIKPKESKITK